MTLESDLRSACEDEILADQELFSRLAFDWCKRNFGTNDGFLEWAAQRLIDERTSAHTDAWKDEPVISERHRKDREWGELNNESNHEYEPTFTARNSEEFE